MSNMTEHNGSNVPEWTLADRLRKIRRDRHLTQEEIASALGIGAQAWAAWEAGRTHPRDVVALAAAIERQYGVSAVWVLGILGGVDRRHADLSSRHRRYSDRTESAWLAGVLPHPDRRHQNVPVQQDRRHCARPHVHLPATG